jgi:hypothetical protein
MGLLIASRVSVGAAVKVEWSHTLLLGEVVYCRPEGEGYAIGLELVTRPRSGATRASEGSIAEGVSYLGRALALPHLL